MIITVAVCTWNRADLLEKTLLKMCSMRVPKDLDWELLVIDNNSSDHTNAITNSYAEKLPLRYIVEERQGLSNARNRAISEMRGDWILFTDDDVLVCEGWLECYSQSIIRLNTKVGFLGGEIRPWFPVPPNAALCEAIPMVRDGFCGRTLPSDPRITPSSQYLPFGANFAINKIAAMGLLFDPNLGVSGQSRLLGEEVVFMKELLGRGFEGLWISNAEVQHYVDPVRLTLKSLRNSLADAGRTVARRGTALDGRFHICGVPAWIYVSVVQSLPYQIFPQPWFKDQITYYSSLRDFCYYSGYLREWLSKTENWRLSKFSCWHEAVREE